jgi:uncharacterized membrane protein (DUF485 family)
MHEPSAHQEHHDPVALAYNTRLGLWLFALYFVAFAAFVVINAATPQWMDRVIVAGLNQAIVYGFALIAGAFVLAIVYACLCKTPREQA